jgi:hypothetical protein
LRSSVISRAPASPVEEFSKQLEDFQKSVPDLNKSIQDSAGAIDSVTDIDKARAVFRLQPLPLIPHFAACRKRWGARARPINSAVCRARATVADQLLHSVSV